MEHISHILKFAFVLYMFSACGSTCGAAFNKRSWAMAEANIWRYLGMQGMLALIVSLIGGAVLDGINAAGLGDSVTWSWALAGAVLFGILVGALFPRKGKAAAGGNA